MSDLSEIFIERKGIIDSCDSACSVLLKQRINQIANTQKINGKTAEKYNKQYKDTSNF